MTMPVSYVAVGEKTSPRWCAAFAAGCGGGEVCDDGRMRPGPVAMFGSAKLWDIFERTVSEGREYFYGDHGYFGRGNFFRVTRNRMQHDGTGSAGSLRFDKFGIQIKPWREDGRHVVVCTPDSLFARLHDFDAEWWREGILDDLRTLTDRELRIRRREDVQAMKPLCEDLDGAWALVTYASNAAVEAILAGIPAISLAPWAAAHRMGSPSLRNIERPFMPENRERWAWNLAANQWTMAEIRKGKCWEAIGC